MNRDHVEGCGRGGGAMEWYPLDSRCGFVSNLFHHLWRKNDAGVSCPNVSFPDTVIFRLNRPSVWCVGSVPAPAQRRRWLRCCVRHSASSWFVHRTSQVFHVEKRRLAAEEQGKCHERRDPAGVLAPPQAQVRGCRSVHLVVSFWCVSGQSSGVRSPPQCRLLHRVSCAVVPQRRNLDAPSPPSST